VIEHQDRVKAARRGVPLRRALQYTERSQQKMSDAQRYVADAVPFRGEKKGETPHT
jgi:hypothetical protein